GTEAAPKGVLSTHRNYLFSHLAYTINLGLTPQDVWLVSLPLIHMAGFNLMLMAHVFGQTVVMTQLPVPAQMLRLMAEYRVTVTALPPTLYVALLKEAPAELVMPEARILMTWASTIPQAMVDGWNRIAPNARFFTLQGSSESTATALTGSFFKSWADVPNGDGRWVGKAMAFGSELRLVDDEGREVAPGEPGEQVIRGPVVMKGYYKNEEETGRVFRDGWFHTGDVLFCDGSGNYYFADRKKDMIKTGGENVFSQEVENVISAHPGVLQCAVFGIPDPRWGEAVTAAVVPRPGVPLTEQEVIGFCRGRLPGYKVPKYVIITDTPPTTAAGKLLKRALR
ncbi:MAG: long-chain fatty acid--CoA ligase, partial [Firmicutes bacterium]|nr:long-chain fatty acid--CoA ligase [Bacillota bacterium]